MKPVSIGIFYFSGTGNTKIVAELFEKEFKSNGANVKIIAIEDILRKRVPLVINKYDIIGMGYPIHAFNAPKIFFDFIDRIPFIKNKKTFTFKTSGDPWGYGGATIFVRDKLKSKGFDVFHENLIVMPANVVIKYNDNLVKQLYNTAIRKVKKMAEEILLGKVKLQKNSFLLKIFTRIFSTMESSGAKYFGKDLKVSKSCNLCEICIRNCPTNTIYKEDNKIMFNKDCALCMRCIYNCPKMAISPKFFKFFMIKDGYNIQKVINDPNIKGNFISSKTKGYFKHFYSYITED